MNEKWKFEGGRKSFIKGNVESDNTGISKLLREREKYLTPELKITELMWLSEGREKLTNTESRKKIRDRGRESNWQWVGGQWVKTKSFIQANEH